MRWTRIILPVEALLLAGFAIIALLYHLFELPMPGQPGRFGAYGPGYFYLKQLITALDLYAFIWIIGTAVTFTLFGIKRVWGRGPGEAAHRFFMHRLGLTEIVLDIRFLNAVLLMFVEFACLKNLIPHINSGLLDDWFMWTERMICGGALCAEVTHSAFGRTVLPFVEKNYIWYFPYMTIVLMTMVVQRNRALTNEYCTAFVLMFLLGALAVFVFPTLGPVYIDPSYFAWMEGSEMRMLQQDLWDMKLYLEQNPGARDAVYMISGFPSLHVAVSLLGTYYLSKVSLLLMIASSIFTVLIIHATIYLGWHYVLDDVGSLILVLVSVPLAKKICQGMEFEEPALSGDR